MLPLAFLLSGGLAAANLPKDTALTVRAYRYESNGDTGLALRVWNQSVQSVSGLVLRLRFNAAPGGLSDLGFRGYALAKFDASGMATSATRPTWNQAPVLEGAACTGNACPYVLDLPLTGVTLAPLEGVGFELAAGKLAGGTVGFASPAHRLGVGDWSLSNLDLIQERTADLDYGGGPRATRIELFADGSKVWGNAPGEDAERPSWNAYDAGRSSFASIARVPSDTVDVADRDRRNRKPGNWLVNQAGYRLSDVKAGRARLLGLGIGAWSVVDSPGNPLGSGTLAPLGMDVSGSLRTKSYFNSITPLQDSTGALRAGAAGEGFLPATLPAGGPYRLVSASDTSSPFMVDDDLYGKVRDAALRFFGVQRSGNSSSWFHGPVHLDDPVPGGWYDCGDYLKEGTSQGYAMEVLGTLAATQPSRDADRTSFRQDLEIPDGIPDLQRELLHGAAFALASWNAAGKDPASMTSSVGTPGQDHMGWTHPYWTDLLPASRGGKGGRPARKELGGNLAGSWAAGLAFAARLRQAEDPTFSAQALEAARGLYAWGKAHPKVVTSSVYSDAESTSELALAAVALLWATHDTTYLHDLVRNDSIASPKPAFWSSTGGWLGNNPTSSALSKGAWYFDAMDVHPLALYAFHRLILRDADSAARYGIATAGARDSLRETLLYGMTRNLADNLSSGKATLRLPAGGSAYQLGVDSLWSLPRPAITWGWNRYMVGNLGEMILYADMARDMLASPTERFPSGTALPADSVEALVVRGMNFVLGQNPWDISFVQGIGSRNLNHPHHRSSNFEGTNVSAARYSYRTAIGALMSGGDPGAPQLTDEWSTYTNSETCLDFSATLLVPATLLARAQQDPVGVRRAAVRPVARPRLGWDARTSSLGWSRAEGGIALEVLDLNGRLLERIVSNEVEGRRSVALPRGVAVVRWKSGEASGSMSLATLGR